MKKPSSKPQPKLTIDEIRALMRAGESFWVGSKSERAKVNLVAAGAGLNYTTRADDSGGYHVIKIAAKP
jgi:hypothetical protein